MPVKRLWIPGHVYKEISYAYQILFAIHLNKWPEIFKQKDLVFILHLKRIEIVI